MKKIIWQSLSLLVALGGFTVAANAQDDPNPRSLSSYDGTRLPPTDTKPRIKYSDVRDETTVNTPRVGFQNLPRLIVGFGYMALYSYSGKIPTKPKTVAFSLSVFSESPRWAGADKVFIKFGETRLSLPAANSVDPASSPRKSSSESLIVLLDTDTFLSMAQSNAIAWEAGGDNGVIPITFLKSLKEFAATIPQVQTDGEAKVAERPSDIKVTTQELFKAVDVLSIAELQELDTIIQKRIKQLEAEAKQTKKPTPGQ